MTNNASRIRTTGTKRMDPDAKHEHESSKLGESLENWKTGSEQQGAAFPEISGPFGRGVMKGREDNMVYGSSSFSSLM